MGEEIPANVSVYKRTSIKHGEMAGSVSKHRGPEIGAGLVIEVVAVFGDRCNKGFQRLGIGVSKLCAVGTHGIICLIPEVAHHPHAIE